MTQRGDAIIYGLLVLAIITALGFIGRAIYNAGGATVQVKWDKANREQREAEAKKADEAATGLERDNAKAKVITRIIRTQVDKIVEREVYKHICLDATGLCLANAAIFGTSPAACESGKPLPAVRAVDRRDWSEGLTLDRGERGILQFVREEAESPG